MTAAPPTSMRARLPADPPSRCSPSTAGPGIGAEPQAWSPKTSPKTAPRTFPTNPHPKSTSQTGPRKTSASKPARQPHPGGTPRVPVPCPWAGVSPVTPGWGWGGGCWPEHVPPCWLPRVPWGVGGPCIVGGLCWGCWGPQCSPHQGPTSIARPRCVCACVGSCGGRVGAVQEEGDGSQVPVSLRVQGRGGGPVLPRGGLLWPGVPGAGSISPSW